MSAMKSDKTGLCVIANGMLTSLSSESSSIWLPVAATPRIMSIVATQHYILQRLLHTANTNQNYTSAHLLISAIGQQLSDAQASVKNELLQFASSRVYDHCSLKISDAHVGFRVSLQSPQGLSGCMLIVILPVPVPVPIPVPLHWYNSTH